MKTNVQPGDRAMIIRSVWNPENVGAVVEVIEEAKAGFKPEGWSVGLVGGFGGVIWVVESLGRALCSRVVQTWSDGREEILSVDKSQLSAVNDAFLRRLPRPDEMPNEDSLPVEKLKEIEA